MTNPLTQVEEKPQFSKIQPVWQFVLLVIATFGIYELFWHYRNWKYQRDYWGDNISPGWRTAGCFVPIYGYKLIYRQFKFLATTLELESPELGFPFVGYFWSWFLFELCIKLPDPFGLISFLSIIFTANIQKKLNAYWKRVEPDLPIRRFPTIPQLLLLIMGCLCWLLVLVGLILGPE